jgi:hypothetical protein
MAMNPKGVKHQLPVVIIILACFCTQMQLGKSASPENESPFNFTQCQSIFANQRKIYITEYYDYIMEAVTMNIITEKNNGTLDTSNLESYMLDSNGDFVSTDDDSNLNPYFPNYTTILPQSSMNLFSNYSCEYKRSGGSMETYCKHPKRYQYPSKGLIYLRDSSEDNKTAVASGLCESFQSEWGNIFVNAVKAYINSDLVNSVPKDNADSKEHSVNEETTHTNTNTHSITSGEDKTIEQGTVQTSNINAASESYNKKKNAVIISTVLISLVIIFAAGFLSVMRRRSKKSLSPADFWGKDESSLWLENPTPPLSPESFGRCGDEPYPNELLIREFNSSSSSVSPSEANAVELVIVHNDEESTEKNSLSFMAVQQQLDEASREQAPEEDNSVASDVEDASTASSSVVKDFKSKWASAIDEESGDIYYYNRITRNTTWNRPMSFDSDDDE